MDYFIAHALNKTTQEPVKSVLQVIKYLRRDEWMLKRAARNVARLPKEIQPSAETTKILNNYATNIAKFTDSAIQQKVWKSSSSTASFGKEALALSGLIGSATHEMLITLGDDLLYLRKKKRLTPVTTAILKSLVYDLKTVDEKRYQGGYPKWYATAPEYNTFHDKPHDMTLEFLKRYRNGRTKKPAAGDGPIITIDAQKDSDDMDLGPMLPPPIATIEITDTAVSPTKPEAGAPLTITISGKIHGVAKELPDFSVKEYSGRKKDLMKELGEWSLRATFYRMQISYLMEQDVLNNQATSTAEKIYVSPYEIEALAEKLEIAEDEISRLSKELDRAEDKKTPGKYGFHVRSTPSAQSIDDYIDALENTCNQTKGLLDSTQNYAKQFYDVYAQNLTETAKKENLDQLVAIGGRSKKGLDTVSKSLGILGELLKKRKQLDSLANKDPNTVAELAKEVQDKLEKIAAETTKNLIRAQKLNTDLGIVTSKTHRLMTNFVDNTKGKAVIKESQALFKKWGQKQKQLNESTIPELEKKALWLKGGAWAAKGVRWGFGAYSAYQDYKKNQQALAVTDMGGGAEDAVLALTVAGKAIEKVIGAIPIPILNSALNGYAKILSDSAKWAVAVDSAQAKIYQDLGFNIRSAAPPAAYSSILKRFGTSDSKLFFNRMRMPLAEYNGLIVIATPDQDKKWLVWDKHLPNGYTLLDKKTHRKVSLYTAWYRRVYGENISAKNLHKLLTKGKIEEGYIIQETITPKDLQYKAETALGYKALGAYLKSLTTKTFSDEELFNYRTMLYRATKEFSDQEFLLTDADINEMMEAVLYKAPLTGSWKTAYNIFTMTPGKADAFNQAAKDWDRIKGGEKQRLSETLKKQVQDKIDRRTKARANYWVTAKNGDGDTAIAAGLLYSQVGVTFNHVLTSQLDDIEADDFIDIDGEDFTLSWQIMAPENANLANATYLGTAEIVGYPNTRVQFLVPISGDENEDSEEKNGGDDAAQAGAAGGVENLEQQRDHIMQLAEDVCTDSSTIATNLDNNNTTIATAQEIFYPLEKSLQKAIKLARNIDSVEKSLTEIHKTAEGLAISIGDDATLTGARRETVCHAADALKQCDSNTERDKLAATAMAAHVDIKPAFNHARANSLKLEGLGGEIKAKLEELIAAQQAAANNSEIPAELISAQETIKHNLTSAETLLGEEKDTKLPEIVTLATTAGGIGEDLKRHLSLPDDSKSQDEINLILGQISSYRAKATGCLESSTTHFTSEKSKSEDFLSRYSKFEINMNRIKKVFGNDADGNPNPVFASALEKANLADLLVSMGGGYIKTCTQHLLIAKVCMNVVDQLKTIDYSFTMPNIVGLDCREGANTVAGNSIQYQIVSTGKAPHPDWEYCVDATDPPAGEEVSKKNGSVLISCFEELDIPAYLATVDCSWLPGGTAVYNSARRIGVCDCVKGSVFNTSKSRCINCNEYFQAMVGAFNAGDLDTAQAWVNESQFCPWVADAQSRINAERHRRLCINLNNNIISACQSGNARAANGALGEAYGQNCSVDPQLQQWVTTLVNKHNQQVRQQEAQRNAQNRRNMQNLINMIAQGLNSAAPNKPAPTPHPSKPSPSTRSGSGGGGTDACGGCPPGSICALGVCAKSSGGSQ